MCVLLGPSGAGLAGAGGGLAAPSEDTFSPLHSTPGRGAFLLGEPLRSALHLNGRVLFPQTFQALLNGEQRSHPGPQLFSVYLLEGVGVLPLTDGH